MHTAQAWQQQELKVIRALVLANSRNYKANRTTRESREGVVVSKEKTRFLRTLVNLRNVRVCTRYLFGRRVSITDET